MKILQDSLLEVLRASDIREVVSRYVSLKRCGSSFKALCPFHEEKTPSFYVVPRKQIFKCFGCGKGGNVFQFVAEIEKVPFPEAVRNLADKAGIKLRYEGGGEGKETEREAIFRVNRWAAEQYHLYLKGLPDSAPAKGVLRKRKIAPETVDRLLLGASPESFEWLLSRAAEYGIVQADLEKAGLLGISEKGRPYDYFRNRFMIPIFDASDRVIGFGGRSLREEDQPKYLNTKETPVFSKGRTFYGANLARGCRVVYLVEGYFDVIVPFQAGFRGFLATLGTALTSEHLPFLRRHAERIGLLFDPDKAGEAASIRGLDLLIGEDIDCRVHSLPSGMDPDDMIVEGRAQELQKCLEGGREPFEYLVETISSQYDIRTISGQAKLIDALLERVRRVEKPLLRDLWLGKISTRFNVPLRDLPLRMAAVGGISHHGKTGARNAEDKIALEMVTALLADPLAAAHARESIPVSSFPPGPAARIAGLVYREIDAGRYPTAAELLALLSEDPEASSLVLECSGREIAGNAVEILEDGRRAFQEREQRRKSEALAATLREHWEDRSFEELSRLIAARKHGKKTQ